MPQYLKKLLIKSASSTYVVYMKHKQLRYINYSQKVGTVQPRHNLLAKSLLPVPRGLNVGTFVYECNILLQ